MPAHIHPYPQWFAYEDRPIFNGLVHPGSMSRTSQGPPRARTLTPGCLSGAFVRFFPENYSLTTVAPSSAHPSPAAMPLQRRPLFRGGSHSVMFRLPCSLAPQMAPTAQTRSPTGSRVVYTTQWTESYLPELWYRYMTESDNYHDGTFTRWIAALSAAPCNIGVYFRCASVYKDSSIIRSRSSFI